MNRLCRQPEIVYSNVWIPSGLSESRGETSEHLSCFDRDPELRLRADEEEQQLDKLRAALAKARRDAEERAQTRKNINAELEALNASADGELGR